MTKQEFIELYNDFINWKDEEFRKDLNALIKEAQRKAFAAKPEPLLDYYGDRLTFEDWHKQQEK